jgi:hypothetical protein
MEKKYPPVFFVTRKPSNFRLSSVSVRADQRKVRRPVGDLDPLHELSCLDFGANFRRNKASALFTPLAIR